MTDRDGRARRYAMSAAVAVLGAGGLGAIGERVERRTLWNAYRSVVHSYENMQALVAANHLHVTLHKPVPPPALSLREVLREGAPAATGVLVAFALGAVLVLVGHRRFVGPAVVALLYPSPVSLGLPATRSADALSVAVAALVVGLALLPLLKVPARTLQPRSGRMTVAASCALVWALWLGWSVSGGFATGQDTAATAALLAYGLLLGASSLPGRWLLPVALIGASAMPDVAWDLAYGTLTWAGRLSTGMSGVMPVLIGFVLARRGGRAWDGLRRLTAYGPNVQVRRAGKVPA